MDLYATLLSERTQLEHTLGNGRVAWLQVARGDVALNGESLVQGDGVAISEPGVLVIDASTDAEVLLFDMRRD